MFELKVATIERLTYEATDVVSVTVPTKSGEITVLDHHIPLVSLVTTGVLKIKHQSGKEEYVATRGGLIDVRTSADATQVIILADTAELSHEIDAERAREAKERAEKAIKEGSQLSREEYESLLETIGQEEVRLKVAARSGNLS